MNTPKRPVRAYLSRASKLFIAVLFIATAVPQILNIRPVHADDGGYLWIGAPALYSPNPDADFGYSTCPSNDTGCKNGGTSLLKTINGVTYGEADPWKYALRNCTSYVAWKENQQFNVDISGWGNATSWDTSAAAHYTVYAGSSHTPAVGEIAQWDNADGGIGHVSYVAAVSSGIATLDEYNVGLDGLFYNTRTTGSGSQNAGTPDHYIHIGNVNPPPPPSWPGVGSATFLGSDHLNPGQTMHSSQYIVSGNVLYALIMQSDGNLVEYSGTGSVWASNTGGHPGAYLGVQSDGNIVIYDSGGHSLWATNTGGQSLAYFVMQSDGNLVAYNTSSPPGAIWANNNGGHSTYAYYGSDHLNNGATLASGYYIRSSDFRYALLMQTDGNLVLCGPGYHVLWANGKNGNPGAYLGLQSDGNIVEYTSGGSPIWATNTNGQSLAYLSMQTDGNLVAYNTSSPPGAIWATGTDGKI